MYGAHMMSKSFEAVYEGGVLRPLEALHLDEHQRVTVVVAPVQNTPDEESCLDVEYMDICAQEADDSISLASVRQALAKIPGSLTADFAAERDER